MFLKKLDLAQNQIQCRKGQLKPQIVVQKLKKIFQGHETSLERPGFEPMDRLLYNKLLSKSRRIVIPIANCYITKSIIKNGRTELYFNIEKVPHSR